MKSEASESESENVPPLFNPLQHNTSEKTGTGTGAVVCWHMLVLDMRFGVVGFDYIWVVNVSSGVQYLILQLGLLVQLYLLVHVCLLVECRPIHVCLVQCRPVHVYLFV